MHHFYGYRGRYMKIQMIKHINCLLFFLFISITSAGVSASEKQRIISTDAGTTEILLALNQGKALVGVDVTSTVPEEFAPEDIGYHRNLSAEGLMSLKPTLVFGSEHIGPKEAVNALKKSRTTMLLQPTATNVKELSKNIVGIANELSLPADNILNQIKLSSNALDRLTSTSKPLKAVFLLYLQGRGMQQAGLDTTGNAMLTLLGANNIAEFSSYRSISAEALLSLQPDLILVAGEHQNVVTTLLKQTPVLSYTPAGQNSNILFVDAKTIVSGISLSAINEAVRLATQLSAHNG